MNVGEEFVRLYARLDDLCAEAERGGVGISDFLSPKEAHYAGEYLAHSGVPHFLWGGYEGAERQRIYVLPEYMESVSDASALAEYGFDGDTVCVRISTDGYRRLSHRDYLGSMLGLGVERSALGDILVCGESGESATVFCKRAMSVFFCAELKKVASEKARVEEIAADEAQIPEKRFQPISDTVASARIDCVVAALCSLSREKARTAVESGLVELDFECEERPDRTVSAPCLVSVRGYGRYRVLSVNDKTKKGRYRLTAEKFL
ncbi:MAG: hypothetical protein J6B72_02480 [Clostridia bacterium]|nr:hypothetical protein [Clostridia bacterium]